MPSYWTRCRGSKLALLHRVKERKTPSLSAHASFAPFSLKVAWSGKSLILQGVGVCPEPAATLKVLENRWVPMPQINFRYVNVVCLNTVYFSQNHLPNLRTAIFSKSFCAWKYYVACLNLKFLILSYGLQRFTSMPYQATDQSRFDQC